MENNKMLESLLSGFKGVIDEDNKHIKVFKSANKKSILDVTTSLNFHQRNKKGEDVYKGKVIFSVTEIDENNKVRKINVDGVLKDKYLKAFVDKSKVKALTQSIVNHTFNEVFRGGFTDFGGTTNQDPSKIRSRILKIKLTDRGQFVFNIDEGKGKKGDTGNIQMIGKPEITVTRYVPYDEAIQMAHEVYDFIRDQEMLALMKGKPLFTINNYNNNYNNNNNNNKQTDNESKEVSTSSQGEPSTESEYILNVSPWEGKKITELKNEELKFILEKTKDEEDELAKELYKHTVIEVKRRLAKNDAS